MKHILMDTRWLALFLISVFLGLFMLQNMERVDVQLFIWSVNSSHAVLVLICVGLGFLMGWLFGHSGKRRLGGRD
ncbi:MAG: lipopolysaccharide assembly protein LapA domain-containing protein [Marivita sp.]|uniref:lipopolysaccharide assembly protein LapA domain-containing protein n=1 Tax=Marivita sp. TaxID=2003365 RepID=UPI003EF372A5